MKSWTIILMMLNKKLLLFTITLLFIGCSNDFDHYYIVKQHNRYGALDNNQNKVLKLMYKQIYPFNLNGYAVVEDFNHKFGVINSKHHIVIDTIYDFIGKFYNNRALIKLNNKYGIIDQNYHIILKPIYDYINDFNSEVTIVKQNNKFGCIDINGKIIIKPSYNKILDNTETKRIIIDNKWGLINQNCKIITKPIYMYITQPLSHYVKAKLKDTIIYLDTKTGKKIDF